VDPAKVREIVGWKIPSSVTKIRSSLGARGLLPMFYRRILQDSEAYDLTIGQRKRV
jgi:hypothetical protein